MIFSIGCNNHPCFHWVYIRRRIWIETLWLQDRSCYYCIIKTSQNSRIKKLIMRTWKLFINLVNHAINVLFVLKWSQKNHIYQYLYSIDISTCVRNTNIKRVIYANNPTNIHNIMQTLTNDHWCRHRIEDLKYE